MTKPAPKTAPAKASVSGRILYDAAKAMEGTIDRIQREQRGQPSAQAYDETSRGHGRPWCWDHGRDVADCFKAGSTDCAGEVISGASDPTGDAAFGDDMAASDLRRLNKAIDSAYKAAQIVEGIMRRYPEARQPSEMDQAELIRLNIPVEAGCALCAKVAPPYAPPEVKTGWWNEIHRTTDLGSFLDEPLPEPIGVCAPHHRRIRATRALTTEAETIYYRDEGRFPRLYVPGKSA